MSEDERLRRELRSLPRESASETFTPRLMVRLRDVPSGETGDPRRGSHWQAALVAAGALLLLVAGWQVLRSGRAEPEATVVGRDVVDARAAAAEQLASYRGGLEREAATVRRELERLRRLAAVRDSGIASPGSGEYDYFIDLRPAFENRPVASPGIEPAMDRGGDRAGGTRRRP